MAPLKDSFGEEWVEMEESEEDNPVPSCRKVKGCKAEKGMNMEDGKHKAPHNVGGKEHKNTPTLDERLETREGKIFRNEEAIKEDNLKHECNHHVNEKAETNSKERTGRCPKAGPLGQANGKRNAMIKRVMSEARFMKGQVMVSKKEGMEAVSRKRESRNGKLDEDSIHKDGWNREGKTSSDHAHGMMNNVVHKDLNNGEAKLTAEKEDVGKTEKIRKPMLKSCALEIVHMDLNKQQPITMHTKTSDEVPETIQTSPKKTSELVDMRKAAPKDLQEAHIQINKMEPAYTRAMGAYHTDGSKDGATICSHVPQAARRQPRVKPLEVILMAKEMEQKQEELEAKQPHLEVKEVECECCKLSEECSFGYIEHVKGCFAGHWVCGLCAEAVQEERHRLGRGVPMEAAVRAHMHLCRQFSSKKANKEPPSSPGVAQAVCHLLSRHLSDPTSPHQKVSQRPQLSRTSSCLPSLSHGPSSSTN